MTASLALSESLRFHLVAVALVAARLGPVAFLCPLLGGPQAPAPVKLGAVLALSGFVHLACGIGPTGGLPDAATLAALSVREAALGTALGLVASLPFDAARMGGRFIDLFRGSSAEAALPLAGTREAATGDLLHHLLLALASTGVAFPWLLAALVRSYSLVPPGQARVSDSLASEVAHLVGVAFSTGLALGAPIAALALALDAVLGLASRAAPSANLQEVGTPVRILGGAAVTWLALGLLAGRLQAMLAGQAGALATVSDLAREAAR